MNDAERALFAESVAQATEGASGDTLDQALDDLGWRDALADDRGAAIDVLFGALGHANAAASALAWVLADVLDAPGASSVVLPALRTTETPGVFTDGHGSVNGLGAAEMGRLDRVFVIVRRGQGMVAAETDRSALTLRHIDGIDPGLGLLGVSGTVALDQAVPIAPDAWHEAVALGQLALSHELLGAARSMLDLARAHALERTQFGRPIAMFQAVRHRLAESLIAIEAAEGLLTATWDAPSPALASMSKGMAGRGARTAMKHCQQVLAGIGFTTEHPFHRFARRIIVLDQLLGAGHDLTREVGARALAAGTLPPTFSL